MSDGNGLSVGIRMYRQGLGDCFLLTFKSEGKDVFNMMIDCGLLQGTENGGLIMQSVVRNIQGSLVASSKGEKGQRKWLDVAVVTHQHADHISGFSHGRDTFDDIDFGEVWVGWMENPSHPSYDAIRNRFHKHLKQMRKALDTMQKETADKVADPGDAGAVPLPSGNKTQAIEESWQKTMSVAHCLVKEFFEEEADLGIKGKGRLSSWDYALQKCKPPRYCSPGQSFTLKGLDGVRIYVLGPPENYETFTKTNPPPEETYRGAADAFAIADSFFAAFSETADDPESSKYRPFEERFRVDKGAADDYSKNPANYKETHPQKSTMEFFRTHYLVESENSQISRRIDRDWLTTAGVLALNLDSYTNNTCLAFAIEFSKSGKVLLFPGDAQFANWISWKDLVWEVPGENGTKRSVTTGDLLKRVVFYKVGHHGSHNATLKKHGLELMSHHDLVAMIPVDSDKARSQTSRTNPTGWEMPEKNLFDRLLAKTKGRVLLAHESDTSFLVQRCTDPDFIPRVRFEDPPSLQRISGSALEPLYVEITIDE